MSWALLGAIHNEKIRQKKLGPTGIRTPDLLYELITEKLTRTYSREKKTRAPAFHSTHTKGWGCNPTMISRILGDGHGFHDGTERRNYTSKADT
jgi:hypothetical protein